jgi:hypothetical protein
MYIRIVAPSPSFALPTIARRVTLPPDARSGSMVLPVAVEGGGLPVCKRVDARGCRDEYVECVDIARQAMEDL